MSARVVGIDPSLTKTGIGIVRADGTADGMVVAHVRPMPKAKRAKLGLPAAPSLVERYACLAQAREQTWAEAQLADLVVIYDPPAGAGATGPARLDMPGAWWAIVGALIRAEIPVARVMDNSVRKAITGKGAHGSREANKVATALAVRKLYPDVELASDDVADAIAAAHLGAVALDWPIETRAGHRVVKWSEWPLFGTANEPAAPVGA